MSNAWDQAKAMAEQHALQNSVFIRLANHGDKVVGAFCGEPFARETIWTGERYETYDETNPEHTGKRPGLRVAVNFYVPAETAMKVMEGGSLWFKDVLKVRDKYGLDKWTFEIERHGEAGDSKTRYTILPESEIDEGLRAKIHAVKLHDLPALVQETETETPARTAKSPKANTSPIDPRVAGELVAQLKALPRSEVDLFLGKFAIQRVRDLRAEDERPARAYIDHLLSKHAPAHREVDPFA
ncbi:MAG: hypothetical protein MJE77_36005 [Proteobacteria bacterium]|nr:hypothetical protein [Pseudomonadota bacterium]